MTKTKTVIMPESNLSKLTVNTFSIDGKALFYRINLRFQNIVPVLGPPVNDLDFLSLHCVCMYLCCRWKNDARWATPRKPV